MNRLFVVSIFIASSIYANNRNIPSVQKSAVLKCAGCHGVNGNSGLDYRPNIASLSKSYILKQLRDFKSGVRVNPEMESVVSSLSNAEALILAKYYSNQVLLVGQPKVETKKNNLIDLELGKAIYTGKRIEYGIPACANCHGVKGEGGKNSKRNIIYPKLIGQKSQYSINQLNLFRSKKRSNDSPAMMRNIAAMMDDEDIESVIAYIDTFVTVKTK